MGLYKIMEKMRGVAYCLDLPTELSGIHNVLHLSSLRKSFGDHTLAVVDPDSIPLQLNLIYEEKLVQIINWKEKELHNGKILLVKVLWWNHNV